MPLSLTLSLSVSVFVRAHVHMVQLNSLYHVKSSDALWMKVCTKENPETSWLLFVQIDNLQSKPKIPVETCWAETFKVQWNQNELQYL